MKSTLYIFFLLISQLVSAQIRISLFNSIPVTGLVVSPYLGEYGFYSSGEKVAVTKGDIFYISLYGSKLLLVNSQGPVGCFDDLSVQRESGPAKLQVVPIEPKAGRRVYVGNIFFKIEYGRILLLNELDVEDYIAGVVEAEAGVNALPEFYKAQSLLCRTYLCNHLGRHESEGFNLCDEVHCQAYKGITPFTGNILGSTFLTSGKVIVNDRDELITAAFHGNCGGVTESSFNTWLKPEDSLLPVVDPYCLTSNNSNWEKRIPLGDWKKYLIGHGFKAHKLTTAVMEMKKTGRQTYYRVENDSMLTKQIRADWDLKSSYFHLKIKNNTVYLLGHGYGHGVGLCQDGAMAMAKKGFNYEEIIGFYFKKVLIRSYQ